MEEEKLDCLQRYQREPQFFPLDPGKPPNLKTRRQEVEFTSPPQGTEESDVCPILHQGTTVTSPNVERAEICPLEEIIRKRTEASLGFEHRDYWVRFFSRLPSFLNCFQNTNSMASVPLERKRGEKLQDSSNALILPTFGGLSKERPPIHSTKISSVDKPAQQRVSLFLF